MNHYEDAIQAMAQADHVADHPAAQQSYRSEALVHATLAVATELSSLVEEVAGLRREVHELRKARALRSA